MLGSWGTSSHQPLSTRLAGLDPERPALPSPFYCRSSWSHPRSNLLDSPRFPQPWPFYHHSRPQTLQSRPALATSSPSRLVLPGLDQAFLAPGSAIQSSGCLRIAECGRRCGKEEGGWRCQVPACERAAPGRLFRAKARGSAGPQRIDIPLSPPPGFTAPAMSDMPGSVLCTDAKNRLCPRRQLLKLQGKARALASGEASEGSVES